MCYSIREIFAFRDYMNRRQPYGNPESIGMCVAQDCDGLGLVSTVALLAEARGGCEHARDVIYTRYFARMSDWARGRLPNGARDLVDTGDVVQEALLKTLDHLDVFEPKHSGAFLGYVRTAVKNKIHDQRRRVRKHPRVIEELDRIPDGSPSPLEEAVGREMVENYEAALERLEPVERDLVIARLELALPFKEIARDFGKPSDDAARMAVRRATTRLIELMQEPNG